MRDPKAGAGLPEAAACPGYEDMARAMHAARGDVKGVVTPAATAAAAICRAILADDGPLRWSCDPFGAELLAARNADRGRN
jgi:hypothetical protein